ncbi:hypothetical protein [Streptomyces coeruleorubidus]|uniref:Uncharacterized protein n=1 Tax=Streptomyces coeruleorubidus TaxID=116188 RepID=A0A5J6HZX7_STRC4|nr:hypothetical protein [Streptomyces coeruleorubidus]QEV23991.1 hypothetical protein CP976_07410 [Streptomyces coeruleorubidus]GGT85544.1 hypothetical protein GCM10010256_52060 [Streptomyces coeruleorubidus]
MTELSIEEVAELRKDPASFREYLRHITGRKVEAPSPAQPAKAEQPKPKYHIPRLGAWPCGTAASGPTPPPCNDCRIPASRVEHQPQEGTAA